MAFGESQRLFRGIEYKKWCPETESNRRHRDFQSLALPTELSGRNHFLELKK